MVWFYVDDSFESHPKVRSIPRSKRLRAIGLWTLAGNWSARHLTDGHIPAALIEDWGATSSDVDALLLASLWDVDGDNFRFHDWSDWNQTKERVLAKRAVRQAAGRSGGIRSGETRRSKPEANASQDLEQNEARRLAHGEPPAQPSPTQPKTTSSDAPRPDVQRICEHLASCVEGNGVRRPTITKRWLDAGRLLMDSDGYTELQVTWLIDKACADEFWRQNILSMPKLREKADQLKLKFAPGNATGSIRILPSGEVDPASLPPIEQSWRRMRPAQ